ncbi:MAG: hypothetical protein JNK67_10860 [Alphaproteobacteria bacterium]|nr:hypothetical protein [Alphaproteobacteria bacterium]
MPAGAWTWLELAKLLASLSVPVAVLVLGLMLERRKVANQELTRKRIAVFDAVAPKLNDILCFYRAVGHWATLDPDRIVAAKRDADRQVHIYRALFSAEFFAAYKSFMTASFEMFSDPAGGAPAKLRLDPAHCAAEMGKGWQDAWRARISDRPTPVAEFGAAYDRLMIAFAREIGVDG